MRPEFVQLVESIYRDMCNLRAEENVLIITDSRTPHEVAATWMSQAMTKGATAAIMTVPAPPPYPPGIITGPWPRSLVDAVDNVDLIIDMSGVWDDFIGAAVSRGARMLTVSWGWGGAELEDTLIRTMAHTDIHALRREADYLAGLFTQARTMRVTSESGTDLTMDLSGLAAEAHDGFLWDPEKLEWKSRYAILPPAQPGLWLPPGRCSGTLGVDAYLDPEARLHDMRAQPATLTIENGKIAKVEGRGAGVSRFREWLETRAAHESSQAGPIHWLLGINPQAKLLSHHIEFERVRGAITWGWGDSSVIAGMSGMEIDTVAAPIHWDTMLVDPTVELDGRVLVQDGVIVIDADDAD
jgi:2,5-dihydroxypyridine 5,6-dioxygenase